MSASGTCVPIRFDSVDTKLRMTSLDCTLLRFGWKINVLENNAGWLHRYTYSCKLVMSQVAQRNWYAQGPDHQRLQVAHYIFLKKLRFRRACVLCYRENATVCLGIFFLLTCAAKLPFPVTVESNITGARGPVRMKSDVDWRRHSDKNRLRANV